MYGFTGVARHNGESNLTRNQNWEYKGVVYGVKELKFSYHAKEPHQLLHMNILLVEFRCLNKSSDSADCRNSVAAHREYPVLLLLLFLFSSCCCSSSCLLLLFVL